jgi:cytochrome c oxidase subunit II
MGRSGHDRGGGPGIALFGAARWRDRLGGEADLDRGLAFPVVVLSGLLIWGLPDRAPVRSAPARRDAVRVTGEMWWWRVAYLDGEGREVFQDANETPYPVGQPVVLELESADVIHSFWVPRLAASWT